MKTLKKYVIFALALMLTLIPCAIAGTGSLRIDPMWPAMVESPAEFDIWVEGTAVAYDVNVLLVMTSECWGDLPEPDDVAVEVSYPGGTTEFLKTDFTGVLHCGAR